MFKLLDKKIITILRNLFLLNWPFGNLIKTLPMNTHNIIYGQGHKTLVIMAYAAKLQTCTCSYLVEARGLSFGLFVYFHTLCMQAENAQTRLCECTGSSEHWLFPAVLSTKNLCWSMFFRRNTNNTEDILKF